MRLDQLIAYLDTSPSLKLLRSPNAAFIIDFLYQHFKASGRIISPMSELVVSLREYTEHIHEQYPDKLVEKSEQYLSAWCSGDTRWLLRYLSAERNEPIFQLTPHTEEVFLFLDRALQQDLGFVGTQSRLRLVMEMLADLVAGASDDPEIRLKHLREERLRIDAEIARVEREGNKARYGPVETRERFSTAVGLLKQLLADFRAVEERFKEITRQVQQRQNVPEETRGSILEFALNSEDVLKSEDQGSSFYEFVRFILSPTQQEKLHTIIAQLALIEEIAQQADGLTTVYRMVPTLLAEAEQVMRTNQRLSATLRRLLDSDLASDLKRLAQVIGQIKLCAVSLASVAPIENIELRIDTGFQVASPFSRTFWSQKTQFAPVNLTEHSVDGQRRLNMFQLLAKMHRLNWKTMRDSIRNAVERNGSATLSQIVNDFPLNAGVVEILGYIQIARDDGHLINRDAVEEIVLSIEGADCRMRRIIAPLVTFITKQRSVDAQSHAILDS